MDGSPPQSYWAIWKERRVIFEDAVFSLSRLKNSFVSALISWAGLIANEEHSFVYSLRVIVYCLLPSFCVGLVFPCILLYTLGCLLGFFFVNNSCSVCLSKKKKCLLTAVQFIAG